MFIFTFKFFFFQPFIFYILTLQTNFFLEQATLFIYNNGNYIKEGFFFFNICLLPTAANSIKFDKWP